MKLIPRIEALVVALILLGPWGCAPRVSHMSPKAGPAGTRVDLHVQYLVGWPRVEIGGQTLDYPKLKLSGTASVTEEADGASETKLGILEDKLLQFRIPDLPPGHYPVTIHDDKGPPRDPVYSFLETTAYLIFPPVWPFLFRPNQATVTFEVTSPETPP